MLKKVVLKNFKCYRSAEIALSRLTIFAGRNAVGKSTVLQALNLLRQISMDPSAIGQGRIGIDGPLIRFGSVDDLINGNAPRTETTQVTVRIEGDAENENAELVLGRLPSQDPDVRTKMRVDGNVSVLGAELFGEHFAYLSADRISPTEEGFGYPDMDFKYKCNPIGRRGEFSAWYLGGNYVKPIPLKGFAHPSEAADGMDALGQQVALWMSCLGQELMIEPKLYDDIRSAGIRFAFWEGDSFGMWYRPRNVGFGLTHNLPIFVTLLSRPAGALVLIENPESHLHPKAQVEMGRFIAKAASLGIQVVVETHSDHILNGVRLAVKEGMISNADIALNFMVNEGSDVRAVTPRILPSGAVDVWPKGFFDEYENVSLQLM